MNVTKSLGSSRRTRLKIEQENAIDLLVEGLTDREVAERVAVVRETVSRWRRDPYFLAELNRRRSEIWQVNGERVRSVLSKALRVIEKHLDSDELQAALGFMRAVGGAQSLLAQPSGTTDPEKIQEEQNRILNARARALAEAEIGPAPPDPLMTSFERERTPAEVEYGRRLRAATDRYLVELRALEDEKDENRAIP